MARAPRPAASNSDETLYFATPADWRRWLEANHARVTAQWVGFHKRDSGTPSITWPESVDEALCFGWIDGVRQSVDAGRYRIRFSPRKPTSIWSAINTRRVGELTAAGRMHPAGLAAFAARDEKRAGVYSFERKEPAKLEPAQEARFRKSKRAWAWFEAQPPYYRKAALHWVESAKQPETRERRLDQLIECSSDGVNVPPLRRREGKK